MRVATRLTGSMILTRPSTIPKPPLLYSALLAGSGKARQKPERAGFARQAFH
jgi:hypothetical protein